MKVIIDTSSLLSLVRYYLPFDKNTKLFSFIKSEFQNGNLILIDSVYQECEYIAKGIVLESFKYLNEKEFKKEFKLPVKTKDLLPPSIKKFYNLLNNNFRTSLSKQQLNNAEFEEYKNDFLKTADARMIILALIKKSEKEEIVIVTEESATGNDSKGFKKIPAICKMLDIKVMTLPKLLKSYQGIDFEFKLKANTIIK